MANREYIERLQMVIRHLHGVESKHIGTDPVQEQFNGKGIWEGEVELFEVKGHPRAKLCYAWSHKGKNGNEQMTAVRGLPPIKNSLDAVRVSIIAAKQNREGK